MSTVVYSDWLMHRKYVLKRIKPYCFHVKLLETQRFGNITDRKMTKDVDRASGRALDLETISAMFGDFPLTLR